MSDKLCVLHGKVSYLERVAIDPPAPLESSAGTASRAFAPVLLTLHSDARTELMNDLQRRYLLGINQQLDETTQAVPSQIARTNALTDLAYLLDVAIDGTQYRTMLSGLCFSEGDDVGAVVDTRGTLLAITRQDQTAMSIYSTCTCGFAQLMKNLWRLARLLFWATMIPLLLIDVSELTLNSSWDLTVFLIVLAGGALAIIAMIVVLCGLAYRDEFVPAWLASSIFEALGRPDLAAINFAAAEAEAPHDGRKRPGDKGRVLYFWPAGKTATVEQAKMRAARV